MNDTPYILDDQVGFLLRRATQRHLAIFARAIPDLTPPQFAVLAKLHAKGAMSQNALGREVAMDAATVKGVVDRLAARGLVETARDATDRRRMSVDLSQSGRACYAELEPLARAITAETLAPLDPHEQAVVVGLLDRLAETS
jgi:DNA-binding MarR family transcriptional regulator